MSLLQATPCDMDLMSHSGYEMNFYVCRLYWIVGYSPIYKSKMFFSMCDPSAPL